MPGYYITVFMLLFSSLHLRHSGASKTVKGDVRVNRNFDYRMNSVGTSTEKSNRFRLTEESANGTEVIGVADYLQQIALYDYQMMTAHKSPDIQFNFQLLDSLDSLTRALYLDPNSGRLSVKGRVDRETLCSHLGSQDSSTHSISDVSIELAPHVYDSYATKQTEKCVKSLNILSTLSRRGEKQVHVKKIKIELQIEDINDNSPEWPQSLTFPMMNGNVRSSSKFPVIDLQLLETAKGQISPAARVSLPLAHDPDGGMNGQISYRLQPVLAGDSSFISSNPQALDAAISIPFVLEETQNGQLELVAKTDLDFEKQPLHQFYLLASDGGNPSRTATALIKVHILDVNDESPVFTKEVFHPPNGAISERTVPGTVILNLSATDADGSPVNSRLRYAMTPGSRASKYFTVHPDGRISLRHWVDYETMEESASSVHNPGVKEQKVKQFVFQVQAIDSAPQPYERRGTATVVIPIIDENDEIPVIATRFIGSPEMTSSGELGAVSENVIVPTKIAYIQVRDPDFGGKDQVICQLSDNFNFSLTPISSANPDDLSFGVLSPEDPKNDFLLTLLTQPDREHNPLLFVRIKCSDQAGNKNEQTLRIRVIDVNDETPKFSKSIYHFSLPENTEPTETIPVNLPNGSVAYYGHRIGKVIATDEDLGENARITYQIAPGSFEIIPTTKKQRPLTHTNEEPNQFVYRQEPGEQYSVSDLFKIDPNSGTIYALKSFDAENVEKLEFKVIATDNPSDGSLVRTGTATVEITITDVNDWSPVFYKINTSADTNKNSSTQEEVTVEYVTQYVFHVKENRPAFWLVGRIAALDPDTDQRKFGEMKPSDALKTPSHIALRIANDADADVRKTFSLHVSNGQLRTLVSLDREMKAVYVFNVIASDTGSEAQFSRSATATVTVFVEDENDNDPEFVRPVSSRRRDLIPTSPAGHNIVSPPKSTKNWNAKRRQRERDDAHSGKGDGTNPITQLAPPSEKSRIEGDNYGPNDQDFNIPIVMVHRKTWSQSTDEGAKKEERRPLLQVEATDADAGENGKVVYRIGAGNRDGLFVLDNETGILMLSSKFHSTERTQANDVNTDMVENQRGTFAGHPRKIYLLRFEACDRGVPQRCAIPIWVRMVLDGDGLPLTNTVQQSKYSALDPRIHGVNPQQYYSPADSAIEKLNTGGDLSVHLLNPDRALEEFNSQKFAKDDKWNALQKGVASGDYETQGGVMYDRAQRVNNWDESGYRQMHNRNNAAERRGLPDGSVSNASSLMVNDAVIICLVVIFFVLLCATCALVYLLRKRTVLFQITTRSKTKQHSSTRESDRSKESGDKMCRYQNGLNCEHLDESENASLYNMTHSGINNTGNKSQPSIMEAVGVTKMNLPEGMRMAAMESQPAQRNYSELHIESSPSAARMASMTDSVYIPQDIAPQTLQRPGRETAYQSLVRKPNCLTGESHSALAPRALSPFWELSPQSEMPMVGRTCAPYSEGGPLRWRSLNYQASPPPAYRVTSPLLNDPLSPVRSMNAISGPRMKSNQNRAPYAYGSPTARQPVHFRGDSMPVYPGPEVENETGVNVMSNWTTQGRAVAHPQSYHGIRSLTATLGRRNYVHAGQPEQSENSAPKECTNYGPFSPTQCVLTPRMHCSDMFENPINKLSREQIRTPSKDKNENQIMPKVIRKQYLDKIPMHELSEPDDPMKSLLKLPVEKSEQLLGSLANEGDLTTQSDSEGQDDEGKSKSPMFLSNFDEFKHSEGTKTSSTSLPLLTNSTDDAVTSRPEDHPSLCPSASHFTSPGGSRAKYVYNAYREASFV
ncbi:unnamed protein product [Calicophoron daubneyi]|uniref:Cadherin domain-containing protein n=1 Tax=Calicophoron daubneyi TaxID=300641 RepID=A0AAV2T6K4_CALDB